MIVEYGCQAIVTVNALKGFPKFITVMEDRVRQELERCGLRNITIQSEFCPEEPVLDDDYNPVLDENGEPEVMPAHWEICGIGERDDGDHDHPEG